VKNYIPSEIEPKWQRFWEDQKLFSAEINNSKPKKYVLSMFPYPSGALHMGHVMNYTIGDVVVRISLMQGYNVLSPIGWDSFGLPAENAAIREKIHPEDNIKINIDKMRSQMKRAGWGFDWEREVATSDEDYYRWTQWLFLQFYKAGLARKKKAPVNWCPNDKTVLANEQVHDGRCERCGTEVQQRDLEQWFFLMSEYAGKLLDNHKCLEQWPERVLKMQKEWIGRSEGALVNFKIENSEEVLQVFTTRPDTLFGVTFISMAPQHPMIEKLIENNPDKENIMSTVKMMRSLGTSEMEVLNREKEGVFTGKYVINPVNGDRVPLYVSNFVLMNYGTGVVMAVPAHDQRDFEFAKKYDLDVKVVINPENVSLNATDMDCAYTDDGIMVNSGQFTGKNNRKAMSEIISWLKEKNYGEGTVTYRLRDWLLSRQRYWGAPIPVVYCEKCGEVAVPEDQLPVRLPRNVSFKPQGDSPLKECEEFMNTECPQCGGKAYRDPDTMDTFVDSSWYYLRYTSPKEKNAPFDNKAVGYWCPVDTYIGGIEHATMHLIYVRFFAQVMHELGLIPFEEPVKKLFCQGMICKTAHYCEKDKWIREDQVKNGMCSICGQKVQSDITKMSKTKLNVVSPETIIEKYGADTMRMYVLADNPPDRDQIWSEEGVQGVNRFLNRLWDTFNSLIPEIKDSTSVDIDNLSQNDKEFRFIVHTSIERSKKAIEDNWQFNTAIARAMELLNAIRKYRDSAASSVIREACESLLKIIAPIVPHISEELWELMGKKESIFRSSFPEVDRSALVRDQKTIVVQVNGKLRGEFMASGKDSQEELKQKALAIEKVQSYISEKEIMKIIVVPGKLVNIVAK